MHEEYLNKKEITSHICTSLKEWSVSSCSILHCWTAQVVIQHLLKPILNSTFSLWAKSLLHSLNQAILHIYVCIAYLQKHIVSHRMSQLAPGNKCVKGVIRGCEGGEHCKSLHNQAPTWRQKILSVTERDSLQGKLFLPNEKKMTQMKKR